MDHSSIQYINIPGLHNSDNDHWQSIWEKNNPKSFTRIEQENWDNPDCEKWVSKIESTLLKYDKSNLILIGHSIGCMAIVHWLNQYNHSVKGVLLVAPSDAEKPNFPAYITGFTPIPITPLKVQSIVVGSTNDHVTSIERLKHFSEHWGSELIILENAGHIETKSGFGNWVEGFSILSAFNKKGS